MTVGDAVQVIGDGLGGWGHRTGGAAIITSASSHQRLTTIDKAFTLTGSPGNQSQQHPAINQNKKSSVCVWVFESVSRDDQ